MLREQQSPEFWVGGPFEHGAGIHIERPENHIGRIRPFQFRNAIKDVALNRIESHGFWDTASFLFDEWR